MESPSGTGKEGSGAERANVLDGRDISNNHCFECAKYEPKWISVNNGIYICLDCAGIHRSFGVQVSFVRSLEMDNLSDIQNRMLRYGGNKQF